MSATSEQPALEPNRGALRTWAHWIANPVAACEGHVHQTTDTQHRALRQLWGVSLVFTCLLGVAQYRLFEPAAFEYPTLCLAVALMPILSAAASFFMMRLGLLVFQIKLDVRLLLTFHSAFVIAYLPLTMLGAFHPATDTLARLQRAKLEGLDPTEAFRLLGRYLMELSRAPKSAWMVGSSAFTTLLSEAMLLLTTLYARKVRDHAQVDLLRAITALTLGQLLGGGVSFVFIGALYLLAYAVVN